MPEAVGEGDALAAMQSDAIGRLRNAVVDLSLSMGPQKTASELEALARTLRAKRRGSVRGPRAPAGDAGLLAIYELHQECARAAGRRLNMVDVAKAAVGGYPVSKGARVDHGDGVPGLEGATVDSVLRRLKRVLKRRSAERFAALARRLGISAGPGPGLLREPRFYTAYEIVPLLRGFKPTDPAADVLEALRRHAAGGGGPDAFS